ncbi:hypothetical protein OBV_37530 [Oscillibacter valericigenes Sjm18-20]|nr:hypothetical protein OBV_37530 [Oscillibacter valericigenes Sjm18-20]
MNGKNCSARPPFKISVHLIGEDAFQTGRRRRKRAENRAPLTYIRPSAHRRRGFFRLGRRSPFPLIRMAERI